MPYAHVNRVDLYYEAGGEGAPTIYIHGSFPSLGSKLQDLSQWDWTWKDELVSSLHFIWYDRRGCFRSSMPLSGYDLENQARDLTELLDTLHIPSAHVIGSSAGGPISLVLAVLYPDRVLSLTLDGTGIRMFASDDPVREIIHQLIMILQQEGIEAAYKRRPSGIETSLGPLWLADEMRAIGEYEQFLEEQQRLAHQAQKFSPSERAGYFAAELRAIQEYMRDDLADSARRIQCPTLVLHGSEDRVAPLAWSQELADLIPTARLQRLAGVGHNPIASSAQGRRVLIDFIQQAIR